MSYTKAKNLICDWTGKRTYLIHYRMLKLFVRLGMIVDKIYEIISFKQSKWLGKNISFNTQKKDNTKSGFEKNVYKLFNNAFLKKKDYGKCKKSDKIRIFLKKMILKTLLNNSQYNFQ